MTNLVFICIVGYLDATVELERKRDKKKKTGQKKKKETELFLPPSYYRKRTNVPPLRIPLKYKRLLSKILEILNIFY